MNVVLINPDYKKVYKYVGRKSTMVLPPLSLAYLAAFLQKNSYFVEIFDLAAVEISDEALIKEIKNKKFDLVGITSTTNTIEETYRLASLIKKKLEIKIVVGGAHPSVLPKQTLKECSAIDFVIMGEGELTMLDLVSKKPLASIDGLAYRQNEEIVKNKTREVIGDLDCLPFPAYNLLPLEKYFSPGIRRYPFATILTSRGCPYSCSFCVAHTIMARKFRARSPENVLAEIDYLVKNFNIKEISIQDDNFTLHYKRAAKICDGLIFRNYDLIWKVANGIRADRVDHSLIQKMKRSGCYLLAFGIESGNEQILKLIGKGETKDQIKRAINWAKKEKILTEGFFIIGNEGDNKETILETIGYAKKLDLDFAQFQTFIPFFGSKYRDKIEKEGKIFAKSWADYNAFNMPIFSHGELTPELMFLMQKVAYRNFYFRPKIILKKLLEIRSWKQFKSYLNAGQSIFYFTK